MGRALYFASPNLRLDRDIVIAVMTQNIIPSESALFIKLHNDVAFLEQYICIFPDKDKSIKMRRLDYLSPAIFTRVLLYMHAV